MQIKNVWILIFAIFANFVTHTQKNPPDKPYTEWVFFQFDSMNIDGILGNSYLKFHFFLTQICYMHCHHDKVNLILFFVLILQLYNPLNIYIALVGIEIWEQDNFQIQPQANDTLERFLNYRKYSINPKHENDNAQLITQVTSLNKFLFEVFKNFMFWPQVERMNPLNIKNWPP